MKAYKNLTEAFEAFKKNAIEHGLCTMSGESKRGNKCYKNILDGSWYIAENKQYAGCMSML